MTWIDDVILGVLETYGTSDPFDLCDYLDISLRKVNKGSILLSGQDCIYLRNLPGGEFILYRPGLRYQRLKFYILHEIGHALLHPGVRYSYLVNNHKLEKQADYFALKLHLPSDLEYYVDKPLHVVALENDIPEGVLRVE